MRSLKNRQKWMLAGLSLTFRNLKMPQSAICTSLWISYKQSKGTRHCQPCALFAYIHTISKAPFLSPRAEERRGLRTTTSLDDDRIEAAIVQRQDKLHNRATHCNCGKNTHTSSHPHQKPELHTHFPLSLLFCLALAAILLLLRCNA